MSLIPESDSPTLAWMVVHFVRLWHLGYDHMNPVHGRAVWVGDIASAADADALDAAGITHVLAITQFGEAAVFHPGRYAYRVVKLLDVPEADIGATLTESADWIDRAVRGGGRVLVHCNAGRSRSATTAAAYLLKHAGVPRVRAAFDQLHQARELVRPNPGFVRQLQQWWGAEQQRADRRR